MSCRPGWWRLSRSRAQAGSAADLHTCTRHLRDQGLHFCLRACPAGGREAERRGDLSRAAGLYRNVHWSPHNSEGPPCTLWTGAHVWGRPGAGPEACSCRAAQLRFLPGPPTAGPPTAGRRALGLPTLAALLGPTASERFPFPPSIWCLTECFSNTCCFVVFLLKPS